MSIELAFRLDRGDFSLDLSLALPGAGVSAVFGPSGCGKTTLLRIMAGLERSAVGHLRVGGRTWQDVNQFVPPHRRAVGYVFQEPSLFPHRSVEGNLRYGLRRSQGNGDNSRLEQSIELLGIRHLLARRPHQLSGGEQQRVAIARALAMEPALLLLDEPLAGLDEARRHEILPYLERLHRELVLPMIYVSHSREEVARLADHLVVMDNGRVQAEGSLTDVFARLDLAIAGQPGAETVIEGVVDDYDPRDGVVRVNSDAGPLHAVLGQLETGQPVRLQVQARDVSVALTAPQDSSILNVMPARIEDLAEQGAGHVMLRLRVGDAVLLARVSRRSARELSLQSGLEVHAQVKSVALLG
ncbi:MULTISPECIES: molybdenum ABC transporter ATP-binding protein [Halomonadaceae]|uniref:Molybdenum ABC transporter ATP-binding protein n=1 Tax=Vreelandella halophila TaxID=86177 RepID=A0A9X4YH99_9GAMM|nr:MULTISPECIES: molybdenum ABC transporter ATP-binding protein [Halomonas]MYL27980.1 molybdenum ABC transporter ATP-binding protein [Halomonas utahensis]MYL75615.1 molybdenum ABC transporter ATP-binding protein [Halomonas sp. 22501_18_FS]